MPCPNCGGVVKENYRRFAHAPARSRQRPRAAASRSARSPAAARSSSTRSSEFIAKKKHRPPGGLPLQGGLAVHSRDSELVFDDEIKNWKLEFDFGEDARKEGRSPANQSTSPDQQSLGACPKDARATSMNTAPATSAKRARGRHANVTCDFKSGKIILQQPIAREQMTQACSPPARPIFWTNFVSNKTRRKFKAYLALRQEGRQGQLRVRTARAQGTGCEEGGGQEGGVTPVAGEVSGRAAAP